MGHIWKTIVNNHFPGRTALQARNQYNQFCRRTGLETQASTPGSMQSLATSIAPDIHHSHSCTPRVKSKRPLAHGSPTATELEDEELDDDVSREDENDDDNNEDDDDDDDDTDWSLSGKMSPWDPAIEASAMQARQNSSFRYDTSPVKFESSTGALPSDGMQPFPSFDNLFLDQSGFALGDGQALEQTSSQSYTGSQVRRVFPKWEKILTDMRYLGGCGAVTN